MKIAVSLPGVHKTTKTLKSGAKRTYYYAWARGPRLPGAPGSPEFVAAYHNAHALKKRERTDVLQYAIRRYRRSAEFKSLAARTQQDYLAHLLHIEEHFGSLPFAAMKDARVNRDFVEWRANLELSPRQRDYAWAVLRALLKWARMDGRTNYYLPEIKSDYRSDRADRIWTQDDIIALFRIASPEIKFAVVFALETGQRQGDLLAAKWSDISDGEITFIQSKTKRRVIVPLTKALQAAIAERPRTSSFILTDAKGRAWLNTTSKDPKNAAARFRRKFGEAKRAAGLAELNFHDFRGTAITRLHEAECTLAQIATITGHSLKHVSLIIDSYTARSKKLRTSAIERLEASRSDAETPNHSANRIDEK